MQLQNYYSKMKLCDLTEINHYHYIGYIMKFTKIALATAMTIAASGANAEMFFSDNSLTALYGQS